MISNDGPTARLEEDRISGTVHSNIAMVTYHISKKTSTDGNCIEELGSFLYILFESVSYFSMTFTFFLDIFAKLNVQTAQDDSLKKKKLYFLQLEAVLSYFM